MNSLELAWEMSPSVIVFQAVIGMSVIFALYLAIFVYISDFIT